MYSHLYVIDVPIRSIAGTHSITEEDLGLQPGTLPPDELATLGNLKLVAKKQLDPGEKYRAQANRLLASVGVKAGPGRFVTEPVLQPTLDKLKEIQKDFYAWKATFLADLPDHLEARMSENPEFAHLIKRYSPDINRIERRLSFDIDVYKIDIPKADPNHRVLSETLSREGNDISKRLITEIAEFVEKSHKGSIQKSQKLVKQNMGPLRDTLLPKVRSFQLLDSALTAVSAHLEAFITDVVNAIDAQPKGHAFLEGIELKPFEARINQLRSVTAIEALIAKAPKATGFVASQKADEERPAETPAAPSSNGTLPKRPTVTAPPSGSPVRRSVTF